MGPSGARVPRNDLIRQLPSPRYFPGTEPASEEGAESERLPPGPRKAAALRGSGGLAPSPVPSYTSGGSKNCCPCDVGMLQNKRLISFLLFSESDFSQSPEQRQAPGSCSEAWRPGGQSLRSGAVSGDPSRTESWHRRPQGTPGAAASLPTPRLKWPLLYLPILSIQACHLPP